MISVTTKRPTLEIVRLHHRGGVTRRACYALTVSQYIYCHGPPVVPRAGAGSPVAQ